MPCMTDLINDMLDAVRDLLGLPEPTVQIQQYCVAGGRFNVPLRVNAGMRLCPLHLPLGAVQHALLHAVVR